MYLLVILRVLIFFFLFFREGQPLKLPETKKTLLFTFNGEYSHILRVNLTS